MWGSLYTLDDYGNGEYLDLKNLILPAATLGIRPLAIVVQLTRSSLLDVFGQDYIRTAKAKGLSFYTIVVKHALKNALNPVITAMSGWFAALMAGSVYIERVFDWKGLGNELYVATIKYDFSNHDGNCFDDGMSFCDYQYSCGYCLWIFRSKS